MSRQKPDQQPPAKFGFLARLSRGQKRSVLLVREHRTAAKTTPKPEIGGRGAKQASTEADHVHG